MRRIADRDSVSRRALFGPRFTAQGRWLLPGTMSMIELRTLGTIDVRGDDGRRIDSVRHHAKRTFLLAHLCASYPPRPSPRATLLALFWPELDDSHARAVLRHELYELRRALGHGVIRGEGGDTIGVDSQRIWCDAQAFEAALDSGRREEALGLYGGEFLSGLHVFDGELQHSLDETRARFSHHAVDAARQLASGAEQRGDIDAAISWGRRETELAPYDESGWQRLILLLDHSGDRGGALLAYDALAASLRSEFDVDPSPETIALIDRIRRRTRAFSTELGNDLATRRVANGQPATTKGVESIETSGDALNALLAAPSSSVASYTVLELRPVENQTGDPEFDAVCRRVGERLAQALVEPPFLRLVVGEADDSAMAVLSTVVFRRGDRVEVRTTLAEAGDHGRILEVSPAIQVTKDALDDSLDAIAAHALAAVAARYDERAVSPGDGTRLFRVRSWQAYLHYIQGSELFGSRRFAEAAAHFIKANELDPSFVKPAIFGGIALTFAGQPERAESFGTAATAGRALTDYERLYGAWALAVLRGRRPEAYRAAKELMRVTTHPLIMFIGAWEASNMGRLREAMLIGRSVHHVGEGWWRNWTFFWEMFGGALHVLGDHQHELGLVTDARARYPEALDIVRAEVRARAAVGESEQVLGLVQFALTKPPIQALTVPYGQITPAGVGWTAAQELEHHGKAAAAEQARALAIQWSSDREDHTPSDKVLESRLLLESGNAESAWRVLNALTPSDDPDYLGVVGIVSAARGDERGAHVAVAQLEHLQSPYLCGRHLLQAAGIRAALDDHASAVKTLQRAFAAGLPFDVELHALPMFQPLSQRHDFRDLLRPRD